MNKNTGYNNSMQYNSYPPVKKSGYSGGGVFGIILLVVVILVVLSATYWAYNLYSSKSFDQTVSVDVMKDVKDATSKFSIGSSSIPSSKYSNEYSISMWINVQDYTYNYGKEKIILRRGDASSPNIEIALGAKENDLIVKLKLQGESSNSASSIMKETNTGTKSQFQDISQFQDTNTVYNINENTDTGYIHGRFDLQNTTTDMVKCNNTVFDKISGNDITYETVKYNNDSDAFLEVNTDQTGSTSNTNNMTIMNEQSRRMKEGFNCGCDDRALASVEQLGTLYKSNIHNISDNSAPIETQSFNNEYFKLVSGNEVKSCPRLHIENFNNKEKFTNTDDFANAVATVLLDVCDIITYLQKQDHADNSMIKIDFDKMFNSFIEMVDNTSNTASDNTVSDNNNSNLILANLIATLSPSPDAQLQDLVSKTARDAQIIINSIYNNSNSNSNSNSISNDLKNPDTFKMFKQIVNNKLLTSKCPTLSINGDTMPDAKQNIGDNLMVLLKKSIYTHISNMGNSIQRENPDLINATPNIKCITDLSSNSNKDPSIGTCIYKMIPIQKWVHVIVSVYNQVVDIYIDGQLGSSCVLKGYPAISNLDVNLTPDGGFSGQISRVSVSNTAMTVSKSQDLYYAGPIATDSIFLMIPNWVWYTIVILIIISIIYSYAM